jgi:hypothetical protein
MTLTMLNPIHVTIISTRWSLGKTSQTAGSVGRY